MPVRTHERHQASRGGLNGSDASGWSFQAVGHEARGFNSPVRQCRGRKLRPGELREVRGNASDGAERRAEVALVRRLASVLSVRVICMRARSRNARVTMVLHQVMTMAMAFGVVCQCHFLLNASACNVAHHGSSQRAPEREHQSQHNQKPDAKCSHSADCKVGAVYEWFLQCSPARATPRLPCSCGHPYHA